MYNLSKRLSVIFNMIPDNSRVADIGTDHAYLPVALFLSGKTKNIIACDIKEKPLSLARTNLDKSGCSFVQTRLGNGLEPINDNEVDCVVIAGMGGEVISDILNASPLKQNADILFLLQPMTRAGILRSWLYSNGFSFCETAVCDNKKVYSIFSAKQTGIKKHITPKEFFIGNMRGETPEEKQYINKQLLLIKDCIDSLKDVKGKEKDYNFYLEAYKNIMEL